MTPKTLGKDMNVNTDCLITAKGHHSSQIIAEEESKRDAKERMPLQLTVTSCDSRQEKRLSCSGNINQVVRATSNGDTSSSCGINSTLAASPSTSTSQVLMVKNKSFPYKLYEMLEESETLGLSAAVSWNPHGRAFIIKDRELFMTDVVPRFFKITKIRSFHRQCHLWGFSRMRTGSDDRDACARDVDAWRHKSFVRGRPQDLEHIERTEIKSLGGRKKKDANIPIHSLKLLSGLNVVKCVVKSKRIDGCGLNVRMANGAAQSTVAPGTTIHGDDVLCLQHVKSKLGDDYIGLDNWAQPTGITSTSPETSSYKESKRCKRVLESNKTSEVKYKAIDGCNWMANGASQSIVAPGTINHGKDVYRLKHKKSSLGDDLIGMDKTVQPTGITSPNTGSCGSWQSDNDGNVRRNIASIISQLIFQSVPSMRTSAKLPRLVELLEKHLYRSAASLEAYSDVSTLKRRLLTLNKQQQPPTAFVATQPLDWQRQVGVMRQHHQSGGQPLISLRPPQQDQHAQYQTWYGQHQAKQYHQQQLPYPAGGAILLPSHQSSRELNEGSAKIAADVAAASSSVNDTSAKADDTKDLQKISALLDALRQLDSDSNGAAVLPRQEVSDSSEGVNDDSDTTKEGVARGSDGRTTPKDNLRALTDNRQDLPNICHTHWRSNNHCSDGIYHPLKTELRHQITLDDFINSGSSFELMKNRSEVDQNYSVPRQHEMLRLRRWLSIQRMQHGKEGSAQLPNMSGTYVAKPNITEFEWAMQEFSQKQGSSGNRTAPATAANASQSLVDRRQDLLNYFEVLPAEVARRIINNDAPKHAAHASKPIHQVIEDEIKIKFRAGRGGVSDSGQRKAAGGISSLPPQTQLVATKRGWGEIGNDGNDVASLTRKCVQFDPSEPTRAASILDKKKRWR